MSCRWYRTDGTRLSTALLMGLWVTASPADITLDGSLGPGGPLSGPNFQIPHTVGRTVGPNLFHSFGVFNIFSGESATFSGPGAIENVFGRVTGGNPSTINGALRSTIPTADVYLVNPQGMMFGPEATLDVQGSFYASTADHVLLRDGGRFDVSNPAASVLTTAPPEAFGFLGPSPAPITVTGSTLVVPDGETLALVGGDVTLTEATVNAPSGEVDLVGVGAGEARLGSIDTSGVTQFADVTVTDSWIDLSGAPGGALSIRGGQVVIDTPGILSRSFGPEDAGDISFKGETIIVRHEDQRPPSGTPHAIDTVAAGTGHGGDISFEADTIRLLNGIGIFADGEEGPGGDISFDAREFEARFSVSVFAETLGDSPGGDVTLNADTILIAGDDAFRFTGIGTDTYGSGPGGDLIVNANTIELRSGGRLSNFAEEWDRAAQFTENPGTGPAGDVFVRAQSILLDGDNALRRTGIGSDSRSRGAAGNVTIDAYSIVIDGTDSAIAKGADRDTETRSFAGISAVAGVGSSAAGDITIRTEHLNASGLGNITAFTFSEGPGGQVSIKASTIELREGYQIDASTLGGGGLGGVVSIEADRIVMGNQNASYAASIYSVSVASNGELGFTGIAGEGGEINIKAGSLEMQPGSVIQSGAVGPAKGGNILIDVDTLVMAGDGTVFLNEDLVPGGQLVPTILDELPANLTAITSSGTSQISGDAGSVTIKAGTVDISGGALIESRAVGPGRGGVVDLSADSITIRSGARVDSSTISTGAGGDIKLSTQGTLSIDGQASGVFSGSGSPKPNAGAAGGINIAAHELHLTNGAEISTGSALADGGDITVMAEYMVYLRDSAINTSVGDGSGAGGNIAIDPVFVVLDSSRIEANAFGGPGGNILIVTEFFIASSNSVVEASSQQSVSGTVDVRSPDSDVSGGLVLLPAEYLDSASRLSAQCAAQGGQTAATLIGVGRGGLPVSPGGPMLANYTTGRTDSEIDGISADSALPAPDEMAQTEPDLTDTVGFMPITMRLECRV